MEDKKKILIVGDGKQLSDISRRLADIPDVISGDIRVSSTPLEAKTGGITIKGECRVIGERRMLDIFIVPSPILYKSSAPVASITDEIKKLTENMLFTLQHTIGDPKLTSIGLAAPQVGQLLQIFIINHPNINLIAINPQIVRVSKQEHTSYESCLSIPGKMYIVKRPKVVKFKCLDIESREHTYKFHDLLAAAVIHEMEHLNGITLEYTGREVR